MRDCPHRFPASLVRRVAVRVVEPRAVLSALLLLVVASGCGGSSGQLKEQILQGAPFDVFASADVGFVDEVVAAGQGDEATIQTYGFGRLVVWSPDALADVVVRYEHGRVVGTERSLQRSLR